MSPSTFTPRAATPMSPEMDGLSEMPEPLPAPPVRSEDSPAVILVVDDDPGVRRITRLLLEARGYAVVTAESGGSAIEVYKSDPARYDLVLLDRNMPDVGGVEALAAMRGVNPELRVLLMSGAAEPSRSGEEEPTGYLRKPYGIDDLQEAVEAALGA